MTLVYARPAHEPKILKMSVARPTDDNSVLSRTRNVLAYDRDPELPGRPVSLLLGGAIVAMVSLALLGALAYRTWYLHEVDTDRAWYGVSFLFVIYVFGVFVFSYAYALYDIGKAVRLTAIVAFVSVVVDFCRIGAPALLSKAKQGVGLLEGKEGTAYTIGGVLVRRDEGRGVRVAFRRQGSATDAALRDHLWRLRRQFRAIATEGDLSLLRASRGAGRVVASDRCDAYKIEMSDMRRLSEGVRSLSLVQLAIVGS